MSDTRRSFLQTAAGVAAGITGTGTATAADAQVAQPAGQPLACKPFPPSEIQVPKMKFGKAEISRLICGVNAFYGFSHYNQILSTIMKEYNTQERVIDTLHQCNRYGINTYNFVMANRSVEDLKKFESQGGKMHLICQGGEDAAPLVKAVKPLAVYAQGEWVDRAFREGRMDSVKEWCKKVRDMGTMVGVGSHKPEVLELAEEKGFDTDFYAGCVYNRTRSRDEWEKVLGGEQVEMQNDCYLRSDPPRMYKVMRAIKKPCFAFKVMAAGRIGNPEPAFRGAYKSIKPIDGVFIGMFPRVKDEMQENAALVQRLLSRA
jgi:hypothetical protein